MNTFVRSMFLYAVIAATASPPAFGQDTNPPDSRLQTPDSRDVPDIAVREIQRRGDLVQRVGGGHQSDSLTAFAEAMRPPADDSHKWFISVLTTKNCRYCDNLKRDFATSDHLKPFVDTEDHTQSWAHFNVYSSDDATQAWRFKDIKVTGYPTILIQPPRSGRFGDPNAHDGKALLGVLQSDEKLVQTLWLFCEEQAQAASVDETEFGRGLDGPTLEQAINALEECVLNFCRPARRTAIQAVREKAREVEAAQAELVAAKVRSPALAQAMAAKMAEVSRDIDQRMAKAIATSGDSATDSRASPASIPVPTRCGS